MQITFTVPGEPRGKGRPRFNRTSGRAYTDEKTRDYEIKVAVCFRKAFGTLVLPRTGFYAIDIVAYLPIPKSVSKATRAAMEDKKILPSRKPDVDNIEKAVLDALNGIAYKDDSRVYRTSCAKYYDTVPRVGVTITEFEGGG